MLRLTLLKKIEKEGFAIPFRKDYTMPQSGIVTVPAEDGILFQAKINGQGPFGLMLDTGSLPQQRHIAGRQSQLTHACSFNAGKAVARS